jgi:putative transposase
MTNHIHLIAIPRHPDSLAKALGQTDCRYAMRFNRLHRRSGHLWQNRFYSCRFGGSSEGQAQSFALRNRESVPGGGSRPIGQPTGVALFF